MTPGTGRSDRNLSRSKSGEVGGQGHGAGVLDGSDGSVSYVGARIDAAQLRRFEEGEKERRDLGASLGARAVMVFLGFLILLCHPWRGPKILVNFLSGIRLVY